MLKPFLEVGQIVGTHGIKGEVRVNPWCDTPEFLKKFKRLYLDKNGEKEIKINSSRVHGNVVLLSIDGINSVEKASSYRNRVIYINRKDAVIPENTYFIQDLIDCTVYDADTSENYGVICDVSSTGANDVWHIKKDGKEYLIPAIPPVIEKTDVVKGEILIHPLKGIFDNED